MTKPPKPKRFSRAEVAEIAELSGNLNYLAWPLLDGHPPEIQGAALADLAALWIAHYPPALREALLAGLTITARDLTPRNAAMLGRINDARLRGER